MTELVPKFSDRTGLAIWPVLLALAASLVLIVQLLPISAPGLINGSPWKVELLASLFAFLFLGWTIFKQRETFDRLFELSSNKFFRSIVLLLGAYVVWSAFSAGWSKLPMAALQHALTWSIYLVVILLASRLRSSVKSSMAIIVVTTAVVAIVCILDYATVPDFGASEGNLRIRYGKFAEMLVTITPLLWSVPLSVRSGKRSFWFAAVGGLGWVAVMLSLSRGALIAGCVAYALFFVLAFIYCGGRRRRVAAFAAVWLALTIGFQLAGEMTGAPATINYAAKASEAADSTSQMRLFTWKVAAEMIRENWMFGVGANNFGVEFNKYRAQYAAAHPSDPDNAIAEDYMVERAHNEPLQIFAELGVVGLGILVSALLALCVWITKAFFHRRKGSPVMLACVCGMIGFAVSSLFSSFSFRAAQNGLAFAIVLGLTLRYLSATRKPANHVAGRPVGSLLPRFVAIVLFVSVSSSLLLSLSMTASRSYRFLAYKNTDPDKRLEMLERSLFFDPENSETYAVCAVTMASKHDDASAANYLRKAIDKGLAGTQIYSALAKLEINAGQPEKASVAMAEAVTIYPRSVFARVRYAQLLKLNGRGEKADEQLKIADEIDLPQSRGWFALLEQGDISAYFASVNDKGIAAPAELRPLDAVQQFVNRDPISKSTSNKNN